MTLSSQDNYIPLTRDEAISYLQNSSIDELIDFVIKYDYIEHCLLNIPSPEYILIISGSDILLIPLYTNTEFDLAVIGSLENNMYLSYEVTYPKIVYKNVIDTSFDIEPYLWTGGISLLTGFIGGLFLGLQF